MVIWLNGSFGVGKTTIANELVKKLAGVFIYDPENLGTFLRDNLKYNYNDYQDYPFFRQFNFEIIKDLNNNYKYIIVPMTLTNKAYYDEIIGRLNNSGISVKHFILIASKETIKNRLNNRANTTLWSYEQVDRCLEAFEKVILGERINTDNQGINETVDNILNLIKAGD